MERFIPKFYSLTNGNCLQFEYELNFIHATRREERKTKWNDMLCVCVCVFHFRSSVRLLCVKCVRKIRLLWKSILMSRWWNRLSSVQRLNMELWYKWTNIVSHSHPIDITLELTSFSHFLLYIDFFCRNICQTDSKSYDMLYKLIPKWVKSREGEISRSYSVCVCRVDTEMTNNNDDVLASTRISIYSIRLAHLQNVISANSFGFEIIGFNSII